MPRNGLCIRSSDGRVATLAGGAGWVKTLHEGTWADAWSGLLNLISVLVLTGIIGTGVYAWWGRRRGRRSRAVGSARMRLV